jgi:hypothetical protein
LHPLLHDKAVADAVEEHPVTRDVLSGGCDGAEFPLVNLMKASTDGYDVVLGDDVMRGQLIAWDGVSAWRKGLFRPGSLPYWLIRSSVFGLAVIASR